MSQSQELIVRVAEADHSQGKVADSGSRACRRVDLSPPFILPCNNNDDNNNNTISANSYIHLKYTPQNSHGKWGWRL